VARAAFLERVRQARHEKPPHWHFEALYWQQLTATPSEPM